MVEYLYEPNSEDSERIAEFTKRLEELSDSELFDAYNREAKIGITGVHAQALYLIAMKQVFDSRFSGSPFNFSENTISPGNPIKRGSDNSPENEK